VTYSHLNGDFNRIVYYQNDNSNFKQTLFSSCTEKITQGVVAHLLPPAAQHHSLQKNECEDHLDFFTQYIATHIIVELVKYVYHC
jgi:hypothetical protein